MIGSLTQTRIGSEGENKIQGQAAQFGKFGFCVAKPQITLRKNFIIVFWGKFYLVIISSCTLYPPIIRGPDQGILRTAELWFRACSLSDFEDSRIVRKGERCRQTDKRGAGEECGRK